MAYHSRNPMCVGENAVSSSESLLLQRVRTRFSGSPVSLTGLRGHVGKDFGKGDIPDLDPCPVPRLADWLEHVNAPQTEA
jgi:hypothetical protein